MEQRTPLNLPIDVFGVLLVQISRNPELVNSETRYFRPFAISGIRENEGSVAINRAPN